MTDLMSSLPAPQPVSNPEPTVSLHALMDALNEHAIQTGNAVTRNGADKSSARYREAVAARDAVRSLILDVLNIL